MASQALSGGDDGPRAGAASGGGGAVAAHPPPHPHPDQVLVGDVGQEYIQSTLTTMDPQSAIRDIQGRCALQDPRCPPLLELMDQLGMTRWVGGWVGAVLGRPGGGWGGALCAIVRAWLSRRLPRLPLTALPSTLRSSLSALVTLRRTAPLRCCRAESHRHVLQAAMQELLARIPAMQPDRLLQLLEVRRQSAACGQHAVQGLGLGVGHACSALVRKNNACVCVLTSWHLPLLACLHACRRPSRTLASPTCERCRLLFWPPCTPCPPPSSSSWPPTASCLCSCRWGCSARCEQCDPRRLVGWWGGAGGGLAVVIIAADHLCLTISAPERHPD